MNASSHSPETERLPHVTTRQAPELSLAIPLYNEESNVRSVLGDLLAAFEQEGIEIELVPVNNGSTDRTADEIKRLADADPRIRPVHLTPNAGYGGGILSGLAACTAQVIGYTWGDAQISAADHIRVYRTMIREGYDLCKARRVERHDGAVRKFITTSYNAVVFPMLFGVTSTDINGCPKMFRREKLMALDVRSRDWFIDPEIMIRAGELDLKVGEVPVVFHARRHGRSNVKWKTALEFCINLASYRIAKTFGRRFRAEVEPICPPSPQHETR